MCIELDEARMERDGLDVAAAWEQIQEMLKETGDIEMVSKGEMITLDHGSRCFMMDLLEDTEWFMKYVNKYITEDPDRVDDVIESYKEMGIKCNYE